MLGVRKRRASQGAEAELPLAVRKDVLPEKKMTPLLRYGVKIMSVGFFIGEEQAVAPMPDVLGLLIRQLLYLCDWGTLDYLIVDLPPGTSEPQATLCSEMEIDGAVLVTTPQDIARIDTSKALGMFRNAHVPVLGVVQNMDGFTCPHCGEQIEIFPRSQQSRVQLDEAPLLGSVPLDPNAVIHSDRGYPAVVSLPDSAVAQAFARIAERVGSTLKIMRAQQQISEPQQSNEPEQSGEIPKGDTVEQEEKAGDEGED